jgi:1-acyl-sn-glycerol-3-phosphate acyltransferase
MIRTAIVAVFLSLYTLIVGPFLLLYAWITGNPNPLFRAGVSGAYFISYVVGLRVEVEGREKIPAGVCFFLANHTSFADPVPIVWSIPRRIGILAKKSLFSIPIIGWAFRLAKFVPVDRANRETAIESVDIAAQRLKDGLSFLAYPEGTRSYDGRLLPFKKGVFVMAIKAGVPIVPVALAGAHRIAPKGSLKIHPGHVVVRFGYPIDPSVYTIDTREELSRKVHEAMATLLPFDQQPIDSSADSQNSPAANANLP